MGIGATIFAAAAIFSSEKARKESKRASRAQQRIENRKAMRLKQDQLRSTQRERADLVAQAESTGTGGSSAAVGGAGSLTTQSYNNISFIEQIQEANRQVQSRLEKANFYSQRANTLAQTAELINRATQSASKAATGGGG